MNANAGILSSERISFLIHNEDSYFRHDGESRYWGKVIPHLQQHDKFYFITIRLGDAVPHETLEYFLAMRKQLEGKGDSTALHNLWVQYESDIHKYLDRGYGDCLLRNPVVRKELERTLEERDGIDYRLLSYVIMPNHIHMLMFIPGIEGLDTIIRWIKKVSAYRINNATGRSGRIWQREYYDRIVRDKADLIGKCEYIRKNPAYLPVGTYTLREQLRY